MNYSLTKASFLFLCVALYSVNTFGATKYWDTDPAPGLQGGDGAWDESSPCWSLSPSGSDPLVTWEAGDDAVFQGSHSVTSRVTIAATGVDVRSVFKTNINAPIIVCGGVLRLGEGGLRNNDTSEGKVLSIEAPIELTVSQAWFGMWRTPSIIRASGTISETSPGTSLTFQRAVDANAQGGRFELTGENTFTGGTFFKDDDIHVWISNPNALGPGAITFDGGDLAITCAMEITNSIVVASNANQKLGSLYIVEGGNLTLSGDLQGDGYFCDRNVGNPNQYTLTLSGDNSEFSGTFQNRSVRTYLNSSLSGSAKARWIQGQPVYLNYGGGEIHFGTWESSNQWTALYTTDYTGEGTVDYVAILGERNEDATFTGQIVVGKNSTLRMDKLGTGTQRHVVSINGQRGGNYIYGGALEITTLADDWKNCALGQTGVTVLDGGALRYVGAETTSNRKITLGTAGGAVENSGTGALSLTQKQFIYASEGPHALTLGGSNADTNTIYTVLQDSGAYPSSLTKAGEGTWITAAKNTYTGETIVENGRLLVTGSLAEGSSVSVREGGLLGGSGTVFGPLSVDGGRLEVGSDAAGSLTASDVALKQGGGFTLKLKDSEVQHYVKASGVVTLQDFCLELQAQDGLTLEAAGTLYAVLQNLSSSPIDVSACAVAEGDIIYREEPYALCVTYTGNITESGVTGRNTGNDIVLYRVMLDLPTLLILR